MRRTTLLLCLVLALAACGDDGGPLGDMSDDSSATTAPVSEADMLEQLRAGCADGDFRFCDILYQASDFGSALESFADTCGERVAANGGYCTDQFGIDYDLGDLQGECGDGDMVSCDLLYLFSPSDSFEESFGDACGGVGEGSNRTCVVSWGMTVDKG